ncbi:MAG: CGNR zinc finger domain-containing protein [Actinomycetota bacterium]
MFVNSDNLEAEIRITTDATVELANALAQDDDTALTETLRLILVQHDFIRAASATTDELSELVDRFAPLARLVQSLPDLELGAAVAAVNRQLRTCAISPSLTAHDGAALHIHWTGTEAPFAHRIVVDGLMALAQVLCDHGMARFGRCAAVGCERVFHDTTKNRSRRFCSDPRCASRTHTAAHRARTA